MNRSPLRHARVPITLLVLSWCVATASAQVYELGPEDRWEQQADTTAALDPGSPEGQLARVRTALAEGDTRRAEYLATEWIERNPDHPLIPDAYLVRGDALRLGGDEYEALFDYEYVARVFTGSEAFITALEREFEIASLYASGLRRKWGGLRILRADDIAEELLIRVQERLPGSNLAEAAGFELGQYYFNRQAMGLAATMYEIFLENFPRSKHVDLARKRLIAARLASFKGPEFDASGLYEARTRLLTLVATNPAAAQKMGADALLTRIEESDARKLLNTAEWYVDVNDPIAAELTLRRLLRRYPTASAAADAIRLGAALLPALPPGLREEAPPYEALRQTPAAARDAGDDA